ncbi:hypothetical protein [Halobaculum litoreum]|uniref:Uncharacterized protein n=1 Tax=Halobaculum litoreum TaxID=3031998 RepID=A0ABD5XQQ8_9EURY|nr:hypothetical protein [Halobaculum sp. DT92]
MGIRSLAPFVRSYRRYGPDRLPGADRREVGAGYAATLAALGASVLFVAATVGATRLGFDSGFLAAATLLALPAVLPTAFLAGAATWRWLPASVPQFGAVAGVVAATLAYLLAGAAFAAVFTVAETGRTLGTTGDLVAGGVLDAFGFGALVAVTAVLASAWLVVPVAALAGHVHERSRRDHTVAG